MASSSIIRKMSLIMNSKDAVNRNFVWLLLHWTALYKFILKEVKTNTRIDALRHAKR